MNAVTLVHPGNGLTGGDITRAGTLNVDIGTGANQVVALDSSQRLPGVDGSQLSNLNAIRLQGKAVSSVGPSPGHVVMYNNSNSQWEGSSNYGTINVTTICDQNGATCKSISAGWGAGGSVTNVYSGNGLLGSVSTAGTLSVDVGTVANKILQLDPSAKIPAVD